MISENIITEINIETGEENPQFIYSDDEETISKNDVWKKPFSSTDEIRMILSRLINELYICDKIIEYKNIIEEKENRDYHSRLWEWIAGSYFKGIDKSSKNTKHDMSYVLNMATKNTEYKVKLDLDLEYFQYTNTSYQVRWFLYELIRSISDSEFNISNITFKQKKEWLYFDDKYYGTLMSLLMNDMRRYCIQNI